VATTTKVSSVALSLQIILVGVSSLFR
jgi:hypothetical protein